ncbi:MAG TPA: polysaccharide lyase family protein, partial [Pedobacter sp.]
MSGKTLKSIGLLILILFSSRLSNGQSKVIWEIGKADNKSEEMALAPAGYAKFLDQDFGWEDRFFLVGHSKAKTDFAYVLPGPDDGWGGTGPTSGLRTHHANVLFGLKNKPINGTYKLTIDLVGFQSITPALLKVNINGKSYIKQLPKHSADNAVAGDMKGAQEYIWEIPLTADQLKKGGNEVSLTTLDGSWIVFDQIRLTGTKTLQLTASTTVFLRNITAAKYEILVDGKRYQPLLTDVQHLSGKPMITVKLDGKQIFKERLDSARYQFEVPMPAVRTKINSRYEIYSDGMLLES